MTAIVFSNSCNIYTACTTTQPPPHIPHPGIFMIITDKQSCYPKLQNVHAAYFFSPYNTCISVCMYVCMYSYCNFMNVILPPDFLSYA